MKSFDENGELVEDKEKIHLAQQKSHFCYNYASSIAKCKTTKKLPPIPEWKNDLLGCDEDIKPEDYKEAQHAWNVFECEDVLDFMEIYCIIDTVIPIFFS